MSAEPLALVRLTHAFQIPMRGNEDPLAQLIATVLGVSNPHEG